MHNKFGVQQKILAIFTTLATFVHFRQFSAFLTKPSALSASLLIVSLFVIFTGTWLKIFFRARRVPHPPTHPPSTPHPYLGGGGQCPKYPCIVTKRSRVTGRSLDKPSRRTWGKGRKNGTSKVLCALKWWEVWCIRSFSVHLCFIAQSKSMVCNFGLFQESKSLMSAKKKMQGLLQKSEHFWKFIIWS